MNVLARKRINPVKLGRMICIILILVTSMFFTVKSSASGSTKDGYIEIAVCKGDTLWGISKKYNNGENIQKVIYQIMDYNGMSNSDIYPGRRLKIPIKY